MKVIEIQIELVTFHSFITWEIKSNKILTFDKWLSDIIRNTMKDIDGDKNLQ